MTCEQIADKIYKILKNIEDNKLNKTFNLYQVNCWGTTKVFIRYVDYWAYDSLTKKEAEKYLNWLQTGNIGHFRDIIK